jgi:putative methylase
MQKRLVRKLDLEKAIAGIKPHPAPEAYLEQYTVTPQVAAEMLYIAAYVYDDIIDKTVVDLGCGTGRLAIGAVLLGARQTIGVDIDKTAVRLAWKNAEKMGVKEKTLWVTGNLEVINGTFDTVLQNPPFGVQRRRADRKFIKKALELGDKIYSLHKGGESNREFIKRFIEKHGGKVRGISSMKIDIPRLFKFHTKRKRSVMVDLYSIEGKAYESI